MKNQEYDVEIYKVVARLHLTDERMVKLQTAVRKTLSKEDITSIVDIPFKMMQSAYPYKNKFTIQCKLYEELTGINLFEKGI